MALQTLDFKIKDISDPGTIVVKYVYDKTSNGFLPPRLTTAQRNAIYPITTGLMVYNSTSNTLNIFNGTIWVELGSSGISGTLTTNNIPLATGTSTLSASVMNQSSSSIGIGTTTPATSALLDLVSTTKGFLPPRVANVGDITGPSAGLVAYATSQNKLTYYNSTSWVDLGPSAIPATYFLTKGASTTLDNNTVTLQVYNTSVVYSSSNWSTPVPSVTYPHKFNFPSVGVYLIGGIVSVPGIATTGVCNVGIRMYAAVSDGKDVQLTTENLVSICGSADTVRPNFAYLVNVTDASRYYSIFIYQSSGNQRTSNTDTYLFSHRMS